jgi:aminopeptidase N
MRRRIHSPALAALALIFATCSCMTSGTLQDSSPSPKAVPPSASPSPTPRVSRPAATPSIPDRRHPGIPGSAGFGDPRYHRSGNGGYDVESYRLDLSYDPDSNTLRSTAQLKATITSPEALNRFNLDLQPTMKVSAVTVNGTAASFLHQDTELVIKPAALLEPTSAMMVEVRYGGKPAVVRSGRRGPPDGGWYRTRSGGAFAAGEPISASAWYPVNEHPGDTATFAVTATVADGWKVISNGLPQTTDLPDPGQGRSVFRWQLDQPIASYLTTIYIDKFTTVEGRLSNGIPIVSAIAPDVEGARELAGQTGTVIDVLAGSFGPYPFGAAGGIFPGESSTHIDLETATRPVYSGGRMHGVDIVVHEVAHHWFGNFVTLKRWSDICINECFASYAVWLWHERVDGSDLDARWKRQMRRAVADPAFWRSPLVAMPAAEVFTSVYDRGPLALQALRNEMGDDKFLTLLKAWPATYGGRHASFDDFEAFASRVAGRDLAPFIAAWFRGTTVPPEDLRYPGDLGQ